MFEEYRARMLKYISKEDLATFELFLRNNDLFDKFDANCFIRPEMEISNPEELMANGFQWNKSPEGLKFWLLNELKWEDFYASR